MALNRVCVTRPCKLAAIRVRRKRDPPPPALRRPARAAARPHHSHPVTDRFVIFWFSQASYIARGLNSGRVIVPR